jgi:hypothetical protein
MTHVTRRRCAERGCPFPSKQRKGARGPRPRYCEDHTRENKLRQDRRPRGVRPAYAECCRDWQASGRSGLCEQHEDNRDAWSEFHDWWSERFEHSTGERKNMVAAFDSRSGIHIERVPATETEAASNADTEPVRIVYPSEMERAGFIYDEYLGWLLGDEWHRLWMEDPEKFSLVVRNGFDGEGRINLCLTSLPDA